MHRFHTADWHVDPRALRLENGEVSVRVGARAMAVLCHLVRHRGEMVTKEALFDQVWAGQAVTDDVLTVAIYELRKALGDRARKPEFIETIHGRGYRWLAPVEAELPDAKPAGPGTVPVERTPAKASTILIEPTLTADSSPSVPIPDPPSWSRSPDRSPAGSRGISAGLTRIKWAVAVLGLLILVGWISTAFLRSPTGSALAVDSIAVLPLADYSAGTSAEDAAFADGMTGR